MYNSKVLIKISPVVLELTLAKQSDSDKKWGKNFDICIDVVKMTRFSQWGNSLILFISLLFRFDCLCPAGFGGFKCERDINECMSNPCQHGGTCRDQLNAFICQCARGYTGMLYSFVLFLICYRFLRFNIQTL